MTHTVLILGASGKIGQHAKHAFTQAGWTIRLFDRNTQDMTKAAKGVDVIVNGMNPPNYHNWAEIIPQITRQVISAAQANNATVILPGNVYNYGDTPGTWSEHTQHRPVSKKGQIRVDMEQAYRRSGVQTLVLRAGNFIDPNRKDDILKMIYLRSVRKHKITTPGGADVLQAFCYLPDWARAAVLLAEMRDDLGSFEDIPFPGFSLTTHDIQSILQTVYGRPFQITAFPWWVFKVLSPVWELAREMSEMQYLWNTSHQLSDKRFRHLFPDFELTDAKSAVLGALPGDINPDQPVPGAERIAVL